MVCKYCVPCVCDGVQEMALAWEEYSYQERSVEELRVALQDHMSHSVTPQVRAGTADCGAGQWVEVRQGE